MKRTFNIKIDFWLKPMLALMVAIMLTIGSCKKSPVLDCFTSTGQITKQEREIDFFKSVQLEDNVNLFLSKSSQNHLVVEAGSGLQPKIITEITSDSILVIRNDNSCNWVRSFDKPINVYLDFVRLDQLEYRSVGDVTNQDTIRLDSLTIDVWEGAGKIDLLLKTGSLKANLHDGTADLVLRGISKINYYYQLGAGKIDALELSAVDVYLSNWGSNNMYVAASTLIEAEIKGLGNVYYKGNPEVRANLLGEGKMIRIE